MRESGAALYTRLRGQDMRMSRGLVLGSSKRWSRCDLLCGLPLVSSRDSEQGYADDNARND